MELAADDAAGAALDAAIGEQAVLFRAAAPATAWAADHALLRQATRGAAFGFIDLEVWPVGINSGVIEMALFLVQRLDIGVLLNGRRGTGERESK
jgi:hypothetical protein